MRHFNLFRLRWPALRQVVERAQKEDLNKLVSYHVAFIRNGQGRVITDVRHRCCIYITLLYFH